MNYIYSYWNGNNEEEQKQEDDQQFSVSSAIEQDIAQLQLQEEEPKSCLSIEKRYETINATTNQLMEQTLSTEERKILDGFIERLKDDFPHEVQSTATLIRFLRARKWKLKESEHMFRNRMKWVFVKIFCSMQQSNFTLPSAITLNHTKLWTMMYCR